MFLARSDIHCDLDDCRRVLQTHQRHHALATVNFKLGNAQAAAMDTWVALLRGTLEDETFPGMKFVIEKLMR